jgi:hypothetical protein
MDYDLCRVHKILRVTPAVETGSTGHVRTTEELLALINGKFATTVDSEELWVVGLLRAGANAGIHDLNHDTTSNSDCEGCQKRMSWPHSAT